MADIYNPLQHAQSFQKRIAAIIGAMRERGSPPPTTPRLIENADGSVTTREGQLLYTPAKQAGAQKQGA